MNVQNAELQYGIVTEYMSGGSIHDHIHRGDWVQTASPKLLRSIAKDITLGMLYLHNEGIIHRDLKSRNILTDNNWHTKIADFDLSRIRETTIYKNDPSSSLIGTPSWMAPELIQGLKYDEKVDVYSFGVVLFELFSGEIPFASLYGQELNHVRIVYDVVKHGARPIIPEYVPNAMKVLISKCWAQDAKDRPSFSTILAILNEENATEKYCCHVHNAHLLEEDEILSISARSLNAAGTHRSSPFSTTSTTVGSSDNMSSLGSLSKSSNSLPADKGSELNKQGSAKKKAKKLPIKISKWIKRIFKHI
jgi:serine/threonine protein kinase